MIQMKHFHAVVILSALFLSALLLLSGCGRVSYKNDIPATDITEAVKAEITVPSGYESYDADFLSFYIPSAIGIVSDFNVIYASAPDDYTEIGVLHAKSSEDIGVLKTAVAAYLDEFRSTYEPQARQYDPSEQKKLQDASYRVYADYVIFTVMTSETQETCYGIVENMLKVN